MTDTTKYHKLQDSSDNHNNNNIDLLNFDQPPPDYNQPRKPNQPLQPNQPRKPNQPPQYPRRAMYPSFPSQLTVKAYTQILVSVIILGTIFNITVSFVMINKEIALKWQICQLIAPFLQNLYNFACSRELYNGNLHKHGNLLNENGNQENGNPANGNPENGNPANGNLENGNLENGNLENGNLENGNQKNNKLWHNFWPLWIYSAPVFTTMTSVYALQARIAMVIAMCAHIFINIAFLLTFIARPNRTLRQDLNTGVVGKIVLWAIPILLLAGGIVEKMLMVAPPS